MEVAGNPYWRGRLSTVDLLVLTSLDRVLFILKILFNFLKKQATLTRRSTVLSLLLKLVFPALALNVVKFLTATRGGSDLHLSGWD